MVTMRGGRAVQRGQEYDGRLEIWLDSQLLWACRLESAVSSEVYCRSSDVRRSSSRPSQSSMLLVRRSTLLVWPVIAEARVPVVASLALFATDATRATHPSVSGVAPVVNLAATPAG